MKIIIKYCFVFFSFLGSIAYSQNETKKWYFGVNAGIDFMTNPPTILTNGVMNTIEGCSSIANSAGNLLFYTDGSTIWNQNHAVMANGSGLFGNSSTTQCGVIVKQPGNATTYYVFSLDAQGGGNGLRYSVVDMTLAAGVGSVTIKNVLVHTPSCEKLTSVKHCNGVDFWVLSHDYGNNQFRANLVTAAGVNTVAVISSVGGINTGANGSIGCLKVSPNGKKLGLAIYGSDTFELYDFDAATGVVSNSFVLGSGANYSSAYGCEFSPDGTKFYGGRYFANKLVQWDLCAGNNAAIAASAYTMATLAYPGTMQIASNGKIYVARQSAQAIGVINTPNALGAACSYVDNGQSVAPRFSDHGLPNFITSFFKPPPPPFTFTVSNAYGCQTASYTAPALAQNFTVAACAASGYSLTGLIWNFGDPASGASNTSTLTNPSHAFPNLGTYTTQLVLYYSCGGGTDTIKQVVNINQPCISVTSTSITCASLGSATVQATGGVGPYSYTWTPSAQTNSIATGLSPGSYTLTVFDFGNNFTYTAVTVFTSLIPLTGTVLKSASVSCNGANTATATVINLAGGSGNQNYVWTNGAQTYTSAFTTSLSAGIWSLTVSDALTGCSITDVFLITQPSSLSLIAAANTATTCAGTAITFTATNSGGTPGMLTPYTYTWTGGPATATYSTVKALAGSYVFTVNSRDSNNCMSTQTIAVNYVSNPSLTVNSVSICPLQTGTLSVLGANSYTWTSGVLTATGSTFTDNPVSSQQYSVVGSALSCTTFATASLILKPIPVPLFSSNSPICNGQALFLSASTSTASIWTGPAAYTSAVLNPTLTLAAPINSGVYQVTVTAVNSCTAATQGTVTVHPTPTLTALGSSVCVTQTLSLSANSLAGANYVWTGPNSFTSIQQNPAIVTPQVSASGNYSVKVTSTVGCSNTAIVNVTVSAMPVISFTTNSPQCWGNTLSFNANATSGALIYNWSGPNGFNSVLQNPYISNVTVPASGNYTLTASMGPCVISATHGATVHPLPLPLAFNSGPVCEGKTIQLGVNNCGVTYQWFGPNGFSSTVPTQTITNVTLAQSGTYSVSVVDANSCQNVSSTGVSILQNPVLTASGELVCFGEPAQLGAVGAANYYWTGPASFTSTISNPIVAPTINTQVWTYTVTGTAVNGCTAIATATIGTRILPIPTLTVTPRVCVKTEIKLQGQGGHLYQWTGPFGYSSNLQNPTFLAWNSAMAGNYTLVVTDIFGCRAYTTAPVIIDPEPGGALIGEQMSGCVPFCSSYSLQTTQALSVSNIIWEVGQQTFSTPNFSYCFTKAGEYPVNGSFQNEKGCKGSLNFLIMAYALPQADFYFTPEHPVEGLDEVTFINTTANNSGFSWQSSGSQLVGPAAGSSAAANSWQFSSSQKSPSYLFAEPGVYGMMLIVKNQYNCMDTVMKVIKVESDFALYVPNAFTPNNDGLNDSFFPVMRGVKKYSVQVFDRWGELIFESNDPQHNWDGSYKGKPCSDGIYNWKLNLLTYDGIDKNYSGSVTMYR